MPTVDTIIISEINDLVASGGKINDQVSRAQSRVAGEELAHIATWVTRLGQLIRKLYGEKCQHFVSYSNAEGTNQFYNLHANHYIHFTQMLGVARAIKHEIDNNLLVSFRSLVQAEVFSDFLEMGEYFLQEGYKDAAAVIIGSVLEDSLRSLSHKMSLPIETEAGKPLTIDPLNTQLAKADAYSKLVQKQISSWAHIRNKASHGEYSEYNLDQVKMMLLFVQGFTAEHVK